MHTLSQHINPNKIFILNRSELEKRLDPYYYAHEFNEYEKKLIQKPFKKFHHLLKSINNGFDFREYKEKGTPYLKVANIKQGELDFTKIQYVDFNSSEISKNIQLKKGNLLLTRKGTFGSAFALDKDYDFVISSEVFYIELESEFINPKFLEIFFNSKIGQAQFDKNKIGAIMGSLSQEAVKDLIIPILDTKTQNQIVEIYEKAYQQKQQKETQAQALLASIDDYLLDELGITMPEESEINEPVGYRNFNLNSQNPMVKKGRLFLAKFSEIVNRIDPYYHQKYFNDSFNVIVNSTYPTTTLKNISSKITSGITPLSKGDSYTNIAEGVPFIRSGDIDINGEINFDNLLYLKQDIHQNLMKSSQLQYGDLMIAIVGATIGQIGIYLDRKEANINQAIALVRLKEGFNRQYMKELIKSSIGQLSLNRLKRPVARANINLEEISTILVVVPPIEKQNEIALHISEIRKEATFLQTEAINLLEKAKREVEKMILG